MDLIDEARMLLQELLEEYGTNGETEREPPYVDGMSAILEMKEADGPWRDIEWPGFFLKYKVEQTIKNRFPDQFGIIPEKRLNLFKGTFLWDVRFNPSGRNAGVVPFMGHKNVEKAFADHGSIALIVVNTIANYDNDGKFYEWHEGLKEGPSEYTEKRRAEGRKSWRQKTLFMIVEASVYHFKKEDFDNGYEEGWLSEHFQIRARQSDGGRRTGQPEIILFNVPERCYVNGINFNTLASDWDDLSDDE